MQYIINHKLNDNKLYIQVVHNKAYVYVQYIDVLIL